MWPPGSPLHAVVPGARKTGGEMISTGELFSLIRGPIAIAEPLGPYTGLRIGGTADYFIKPRDREDLCRAFGYFRKHRFPFLILGRGSRLLVHETGFRGTVIATRFLDRVVIDGDRVEADAGVTIPVLEEMITRASLERIGDFGRGAGTVGGALSRIDGQSGGHCPDALEWIDVIRNGRVRRLKNGEMHKGVVTVGDDADVVLGAGFRLRRRSGKDRPAGRKAVSIQAASEADGALAAMSGKIFSDPVAASGEPAVTAGELLTACGLSCERRGAASFSDTDVNHIVNHGGATSGDVLELVRFARESVQAKFGIRLGLDLVLVGNKLNGIHDPFI